MNVIRCSELFRVEFSRKHLVLLKLSLLFYFSFSESNERQRDCSYAYRHVGITLTRIGTRIWISPGRAWTRTARDTCFLLNSKRFHEICMVVQKYAKFSDVLSKLIVAAGMAAGAPRFTRRWCVSSAWAGVAAGCGDANNPEEVVKYLDIYTKIGPKN